MNTIGEPLRIPNSIQGDLQSPLEARYHVWETLKAYPVTSVYLFGSPLLPMAMTATSLSKN